jgi:CheY-like chemotaxis protein
MRLDDVSVLVVDDDPDTRHLLAVVLSLQGAAVSTAASAPEALGTVMRTPPDVIVSDVGMPGQDGCDLMRSVRALPAERGGQIPAVAVTAFAGREHRVRALAAGFHSYMVKPVEPNELTWVVGMLARRRDMTELDWTA